MFGRIVKFVTAERENYGSHFCGPGEPATQDYQPGTLAPNEPIVLIQAAPLRPPVHSSLVHHVTYSFPNVLYFSHLKC